MAPLFGSCHKLRDGPNDLRDDVPEDTLYCKVICFGQIALITNNLLIPLKQYLYSEPCYACAQSSASSIVSDGTLEISHIQND